MKKIWFMLHRVGICFMIGCLPQSIVASPEQDRLTNVAFYQNHASSRSEDLIVKKLNNGKYEEALRAVNNRLKKDPSNLNMLLYKADILVSLEEYDKATDVMNQIMMMDPENKKAIKLKKYLSEKLSEQVHNKLGFSQNEVFVSDLDRPWSFSSLSYYRLTDYGTFGARFNYANRFGIDGIQYQIEAYPKFFQVAHADLMFAFSDSSERVFPKYQYRVEPYFSLSKNIEFSLGQYYSNSFNKSIYTYTGSVAYHFNNYNIWLRPSRFEPKPANFIEVGLSRYFTDENTYLSVKAGAGKMPDIGDLPPLDEIITLKTYLINVTGQMALNKSLFLRGWVGYTKQEFDTGNLRELFDVAGEIIWRY